MPFDRVIDSETHDYVDDGAGGLEVTTTVATSLYTQFHIALNEWWGRSEAGNTLHELLLRGDTGEDVIQEARESLITAMQPLLDQGRIADPILKIDKDKFGRILIVSSVLDVQSGTRIALPIRVGV